MRAIVVRSSKDLEDTRKQTVGSREVVSKHVQPSRRCRHLKSGCDPDVVRDVAELAVPANCVIDAQLGCEFDGQAKEESARDVAFGIDAGPKSKLDRRDRDNLNS